MPASPAAAPPVGGRLPGRRRRRPRVAPARNQALIPLRPLIIGEIMDVAFLIIQRNAAAMVGMPLALAAGIGAMGLGGVLGFYLLANYVSEAVATVVSLLFGLLGLLVVAVLVVWQSAVLSRVAIQTALGDGFAPRVTKVTLRSSLRLLPPMLAFTLLAGFAASTWNSLCSSIVLLGALAQDQSQTVVLTVAAFLASLGAFVWGLSYLAAAVPSFALESPSAPGWVGKPSPATSSFGAFFRSFQLIGLRQSGRALLLSAGSLLLVVVSVTAAVIGGLLMLVLYSSALGEEFSAVIDNPYVVAVIVITALVAALSVSLCYQSAAQAIFYLDLRMRREGLDLALRFDLVSVPQPSDPPLRFPLPAAYPTPAARWQPPQPGVGGVR